MKIRVDFTIDVPAESLEALRELAGNADTNAWAAEFVRMDAGEYTVNYLRDNGVQGITLVDNTLIREARRAGR